MNSARLNLAGCHHIKRDVSCVTITISAEKFMKNLESENWQRDSMYKQERIRSRQRDKKKYWNYLRHIFVHSLSCWGTLRMSIMYDCVNTKQIQFSFLPESFKWAKINNKRSRTREEKSWLKKVESERDGVILMCDQIMWLWLVVYYKRIKHERHRKTTKNIVQCTGLQVRSNLLHTTPVKYSWERNNSTRLLDSAYVFTYIFMFNHLTI